MINIGTFGKILRTERESQGIDLETASEATKIRKHYLNALEEENFEILPARVYAIGFVASYARFLHLNPDAMVSQFKSMAYPDTAGYEPEIVTHKKPSGINLPPVKNIMAAVLFLIVIIWTGSLISDFIAQKGTEQPPASQEPAGINNTPDQTDNTPAQVAAPEGLVLQVAARQKCWLQVKVDGTDQYTGIMQAGENKTFEAANSIIVKAGNAGGIDLLLNDQPVAPLGSTGQVVEKKFDKSSIAKE